jgi:hypothetical protein
MAVNRYMRLFSYFQWIDIGQYNSKKKAYHMFPFYIFAAFYTSQESMLWSYAISAYHH